jgi:hypothetical protein
MVLYLKIPYMTRETCKAELARTVAVTPNLRYVDLPEGFFNEDPSTNALRAELEANCPDIRKMIYMRGSGASFEGLRRSGHWSHLEVVEFSQINIDIRVLRQGLGFLPYLREVKFNQMSIGDQMFTASPSPELPSFPAVRKLTFVGTPNITTKGLCCYLISQEGVPELLNVLIFSKTGVTVQGLHEILSLGHQLKHLSITESVMNSFPAGEVALMKSKSLEVLNYEILSSMHADSFTQPSVSYYDYLTRSILSNGLPVLRELYVRDADFTDSLTTLAPPRPAFFRDEGVKVSNNSFAAGFTQELEVYSKGIDEMEWNFARVQPPTAGRRGSTTQPRPLSSYGASSGLSPQWGGTARRSVIVGNGFGGFLAVPADNNGRPSSSAGETGKRSSRMDLFR